MCACVHVVEARHWDACICVGYLCVWLANIRMVFNADAELYPITSLGMLYVIFLCLLPF